MFQRGNGATTAIRWLTSCLAEPTPSHRSSGRPLSNVPSRNAFEKNCASLQSSGTLDNVWITKMDKRLTLYAPVLVPALYRIQQQFGYLKPEALEEFSKESGVPQYRLQAVASFFPHFLLTRPKKVVLRVCRDLSCNLAGSGKMLPELDALTSEYVAVEGGSVVSG